MRPDYVIVGHLSLDSIEGDADRLGGTAAYAARAARLLGRKVGVVTASPQDPQEFDELQGIEYLSLSSPEWTRFENHYVNGKRRQRWISTATHIEVDDVPTGWQVVPIVHIGPIAQEIDPDFAMGCPAELNCATLQGWLRGRASSSKVLIEVNAGLETGLKYLDAAVVSEEDLLSDPVLVEQLAENTRLLAVTRGKEGCDLYTEGQRQRITTSGLQIEDPTGAGDFFAAAFFVKLSQKHDAIESARFANRFAAWILEDRNRLEIDPERFEQEFPEAE